MNGIVVGIIGSGFAARLHCEAYRYLHGVQVRIGAVASLAPDVAAFAAEFSIPRHYSDYREMLEDPTIQAVDIIVPPALHRQCVLDALAAGKHVICEKPLTGYFGAVDDEKPVGLHTSREKMYRQVLEELAELKAAVKKSRMQFMYAENWVYAPAIQKSAELLRSKKTKQLFIKAEESHSGSHAPHAAHWSENGGGSMIRQGCHPLTAVLYLKGVEARARGEQIEITSVMADTAVISPSLSEYDRRYIDSLPIDVEDWACASLGFSDGTRAVILSGDMVLGGVRNYVEIYGTDGVMLNNISPNNALESYFVDEEGLGDIYFTEKVQNKTGWQKIFLEEAINRGYVGELQDFAECLRDGRQPLSGLDLACKTTQAVYAIYLSAATGRRVELSD